MASGPVVPMVWEGLNVVKTGRVMLGETNPKEPNRDVYQTMFENFADATISS